VTRETLPPEKVRTTLGGTVGKKGHNPRRREEEAFLLQTGRDRPSSERGRGGNLFLWSGAFGKRGGPIASFQFGGKGSLNIHTKAIQKR